MNGRPNLSLPGLLAQDAWACLQFCRSRAPSFGHALREWQRGQRQRLQCLQRLSAGDAAKLLGAERACRRAGLAFPGPGAGRCAPWHLDEHLLQAPLSALPHHPLIDPDWLAARLGGRAPDMPALQTLMRWLAAPPPQGPLPAGMAKVQGGAGARIAVCLHLYYPETWPEFAKAFSALPEPCDLYVTLPDFTAHPVLDELAAHCPRATLVRSPNRGRDVLPFLCLLAQGRLDRYDWVCKLHSKKSPHMAAGNVWRQRLLEGLLGPGERVANLLRLLRAEPSWGLWAPAEHWIASDDAKWLGTNAASMQRLQRLTGLSAAPVRPPYVAGTMFWVRPGALKQLRRLGTQPDAFEPEFGQTDGTLAHAVERGVAMDVKASRLQPSDLHP